MSTAQKIQLYSIEEYFAFEREVDVRHEYLDGEIVAMGGASRSHNRLVVNLTVALQPHLGNTLCRLSVNDMKVYIKAVNRAYYPDLVVSCSDPAEEPDEYTETQPCLVIEVLSPSTASLDRTEKRRNYQQLKSLQEYVLVAQEEPIIEVYRREADGWTYTLYRDEDSVHLQSINLNLPLPVIYRGLSISPR
jgi:Uma2 family endonuclease